MNLIISPTRNYLSVFTVSSLLFAKHVGPPLTDFKPKSYMKSWRASRRHSADDTNSKERIVSVADSQFSNVCISYVKSA